MINSKKIAIDARMIEMSGVGTYIQHLMGQGIYDYALGDEKLIRKYDKEVKVIPFHEKIYSLNEQICFPYQKIKKEKIDCIHFPHYNVPLFYRDKYIVTVHDLIHLKFPQYLRNDIARLYSRILMKHAVSSAQQILTVSQSSKNDLMKYFGIPKDKITVTYNAADQRFHRQSDEEIENFRSKLHIKSHKKIILYVGNLKPHKNLKVLLEAFSKIKNKDNSLLLLVGKIFDHNYIEEYVQKYDITDSVIMTGKVDNEMLVHLYNLADVFVFPSIYEGFGIPPLESMACGTPVICSDSSSLPEVVGDSAILFNSYDADELAADIDELLENAALYQNLVNKGYKQIEKFNWKITVSKTKETISQLTK